jgi:hypothetical protein
MSTPYSPPGKDPTGNPHPSPVDPPQPAAVKHEQPTNYDERAVDLHDTIYSNKRPHREDL